MSIRIIFVIVLILFSLQPTSAVVSIISISNAHSPGGISRNSTNELPELIMKGRVKERHINSQKEKNKFRWAAFLLGFVLIVLGPVLNLIYPFPGYLLFGFLFGLLLFLLLMFLSKNKNFKKSLLYGYLLGLLLLLGLALIGIGARIIVRILVCHFGTC